MTRPVAEATRDIGTSPALRRAATALWVAGIGLAIALVVMRVAIARLGGPAAQTWVFVTIAVVTVIYAVLGRLLVSRRPRQLVGWIFLAAPVAVNLVFLGFSTTDWPIDSPVVKLMASVGAAIFPVAILLAFPLLAVVFPDGRLPGPRWRWPVGIVVGASLAAAPVNFLGVMTFGPAADPTLDPTRISLPSAILFVAQSILMLITIAGGVILAVLAIIARVGRGTPDERRQLAWFLGAVLIVVVIEGPRFLSEASTSWFDVVGVLSLALLPASVTLAILRYHLYDIDRIVSRTLAYAIVTAVLVAVFAGAVLGLQTALDDVTGGDTVPVALSTLLVLSLFQPLRTRVQGTVDRRFDRARGDAAKTIDAFGRRLRDEVDLATVRAGTLATADALVHPTSASLWLRAR
jgi:hypothetical protein